MFLETFQPLSERSGPGRSSGSFQRSRGSARLSWLHSFPGQEFTEVLAVCFLLEAFPALLGTGTAAIPARREHAVQRCHSS